MGLIRAQYCFSGGEKTGDLPGKTLHFQLNCVGFNVHARFHVGVTSIEDPPHDYKGVFDQMAEVPVNYGHLVSTDSLQYTCDRS